MAAAAGCWWGHGEPFASRRVRRCTRNPLGLSWDGTLMFSQVGGAWEDSADKPSGWQQPHLCSPGSAREREGAAFVGTRRWSAFCNLPQFCNWVSEGQKTTCQHKWTARQTWQWGSKLPSMRLMHLAQWPPAQKSQRSCHACTRPVLHF